MSHSPHPCRRRKGIYLRYSTKNWSDEFACPACGLSRRYNLNLLGSRRVPMCDGERIVAGPALPFGEWRALVDAAEGKANVS